MTPIKTALCSFGMSGKVFHAPLLHAHPGFALTSVWQRSKNDVLDFYPEVKVVRQLHELLADPEIELVVVNTPEASHFEFAKAALEAGKHVVVEKAFTTTVAEANQLIALAKEKGVLLSVYQNRRWDSDFLTVQKILSEGKLGRLVSFEVHYDRYRTYIQDSWKEVPAPGTSLLYNLGSHLIDQILVLFGMPEKVFGEETVQRTGGKIDDYFYLRMYYPGMVAVATSSYLVREPGPRYQLLGEEGTFYKWGLDPQEEALKAGQIPGSENWGQEAEADWGLLHAGEGKSFFRGRVPSEPGNYLAYYENIHAAIREGAELAVTAEQARDVIRIIEALHKSDEKGILVSL
jgi:scyllo-inositol 2-dehydrogenase (NADP+)